MLRAGQLNDKITVYRPLNASETTQDSYGKDLGTPETVGSFWCRITHLQGRELLEASQRWSDARFKIEMETQPGITFTTKMYAEWGARQLNILDVQDSNEARLRPMILMYASEVS